MNFDKVLTGRTGALNYYLPERYIAATPTDNILPQDVEEIRGMMAISVLQTEAVLFYGYEGGAKMHGDRALVAQIEPVSGERQNVLGVETWDGLPLAIARLGIEKLHYIVKLDVPSGAFRGGKRAFSCYMTNVEDFYEELQQFQFSATN